MLYKLYRFSQPVSRSSRAPIVHPCSAVDDKELGQAASQPWLGDISIFGRCEHGLQDLVRGFHNLHVKSGQFRPDVTVRLQ